MIIDVSTDLNTAIAGLDVVKREDVVHPKAKQQTVKRRSVSPLPPQRLKAHSISISFKP